MTIITKTERRRLTPDAISRLKSFNWIDEQLYSRAKQRLHDQVWKIGRDKVHAMKTKIEKLSQQLKHDCTTESGAKGSSREIHIQNPSLSVANNATCFSMVKQSSLVGYLAIKQILKWKHDDSTWRGDPISELG